MVSCSRLFVFAIILHLINWIHSPFLLYRFHPLAPTTRLMWTSHENKKIKKKRKKGKWNKKRNLFEAPKLLGAGSVSSQTHYNKISFASLLSRRPSLSSVMYPGCFPSDILETEETLTIFWKKNFSFFFSLFILLFLKGNFPPSLKCRSLFECICVYMCVSGFCNIASPAKA